MIKPKVFISYSWKDQTHQELVKHWADRLLSDGIEVILDIYDLIEGHDKYAFMEKMVTDNSVTHTLIICDESYAEKADARKAGVGTESQIISREVYEKVEQSKFIPIIAQLDSLGQPYLPIFLKSRKWINFSSSEYENENWEQLLRLLYGKPLHVKPIKGRTPSFITNEVPLPTSEVFAKFNSLKQAILNDKKGIKTYRSDFLEACFNYADDLRIRTRPDDNLIRGEKVLDDVGKLKKIRDHLVDWVLLESEVSHSQEFIDTLFLTLEKLLELKSRPPEITSWVDSFFEAHSLFVYETFLYIIAALIKTESYQIINDVLTNHFLRASTERYGDNKFQRFDIFYSTSDTLQSILAPKGQTLHSPAGELIKLHSDRSDLPLVQIIQAELVVFLMATISSDLRWYPQTFYYSLYNKEFPLFIRSTQHRHFQKLTAITGVGSALDLRERVKLGFDRLNITNRNSLSSVNLWSSLNMDNLDTLK